MNKTPTPEYMQTQSILRLCRYVVIHGEPWMSPAQEELARRGENPRLCYDRVYDEEHFQALRAAATWKVVAEGMSKSYERRGFTCYHYGSYSVCE